MQIDKCESIKLALEHSRGLFIYHADQRIKSLNFYFIAISIFLTGFGLILRTKLSDNSMAFVGFFLSLFGVLLTMQFHSLDKRNQQLVKYAEDLLKVVEEKMAKLPNARFSEWEVTKRADDVEDSVEHFSSIVPSIFAVYIAFSIVCGIYSIWPLLSEITHHLVEAIS